MPEVSSHPPGFASWAELASPDPRASLTFYRGLFGWHSYTLTTEIGDYEVFTLGDAQGPPVAGLYGLADDAQPQTWTIYFRSEDLSATIATVVAAGGQELVEPIDISSLGQMAMCEDSLGAEFALWKPYTFEGAAVIDEPGALCWTELVSPDAAEARRFYGGVFGWKAVDRSYFSRSYTDWKIGNYSVAGMLPLDEMVATARSPGWTPCFCVSDCDATARRATELGGDVHFAPSDLVHGRVASMTDPAGARFTVLAPYEDLGRVKTAP
ncbi:MAG TPA: VOC family protein [Spirillospora sp.]